MIVVCVQSERSKFYGNLPGHDQQLDYSALDGGDEILCVRRGGTVLHCASNLLDYRIYKRINCIRKLINVVCLQCLSKLLHKLVATLLKSIDVFSNRSIRFGFSKKVLNHSASSSSFARKLFFKNNRNLFIKVRIKLAPSFFLSIVPMKLPLTVLANVLLNKALNRIHLQNIIFNPSLHFNLKL
ncbi:5-Nitroimidazole antibiotic resistance, putative [Babesia ovata]|uniref:5-Nitroimidazole antibiotic resistance, putative n=1 Tax=Babesia ovata TaxID=189622 RepID=A0A2H6KDA4_9APIC|nr:5-Nitroimidazole antibiotic resistance, putative [Babesia ovata]GBE60964.1 5-Nitroimidazole antibiotic resistance, putative [Babesia ovata]